MKFNYALFVSNIWVIFQLQVKLTPWLSLYYSLCSSSWNKTTIHLGRILLVLQDIIECEYLIYIWLPHSSMPWLGSHSKIQKSQTPDPKILLRVIRTVYFHFQFLDSSVTPSFFLVCEQGVPMECYPSNIIDTKVLLDITDWLCQWKFNQQSC